MTRRLVVGLYLLTPGMTRVVFMFLLFFVRSVHVRARAHMFSQGWDLECLRCVPAECVYTVSFVCLLVC